MNLTLKRLTPFLGLLVLLAGCSTATNPVAPVVSKPLSSLTISPQADTLMAGETVQFTAAAVDTFGIAYPGPFNWASSDPGVFTVNSSGLVQAAGEGSALLIVSGGGKADTAHVLVYPVAPGWVIQTSNATEDLYGVFIDRAGRLGWAVGDGGLVLSTTDAGANWTRSLPTTANLRAVWFTSAQEGWAVGTIGTVLHTLDAGASWTLVTSSATTENLMGVYFATRDTGWVVGGGGLILGTRDRGETWTKTYRSGVRLNSVMFSGTRDGWAVGENGVIVGTHDRGDTWFLVQPSLTSWALKGLWRRSVTRSVAVGAQGVVLGTEATPDSVAWLLGNAGSSYQFEGVCFADSTAGWAVGWNGTAGSVLYSDDDGGTWTPQVANSTSRLRGVYFVDARRGWAVGDAGIIRHTSSGGW